LTVRISDFERDLLLKLSNHLNKSYSEIVRLAIFYLAKQKLKITQKGIEP
jgi:hypothetical protein